VRTHHAEPVNVDDVVHHSRVGVAKDAQELVVKAQVQADALGLALLVRRAERGKHAIVRLAGLVEARDLPVLRQGVVDAQNERLRFRIVLR